MQAGLFATKSLPLVPVPAPSQVVLIIGVVAGERGMACQPLRAVVGGSARVRRVPSVRL